MRWNGVNIAGDVRRPARFVTGALLLAWMYGTPAVLAAPVDNPSSKLGAEARFHGGPTYDLVVTNVKWEAATKDYSYVTFDLSWSFSWRAKWTEPATNNVTGAPLEMENWDAAWVFVKFLPEKDSKESIERNEWRHAMLDTDASHNVMPAGATNSVGLTDDGSTGLGVFIHRDAIGTGRNDFKGVKLRWLHRAGLSTSIKAGKVDPAKAAIKVHAIAMVYVPDGPFKVGSGSTTRIDRFPDGPTLPILQGQVGDELGSFTDGSWRGGPIVPFLVDAEWNGPVVEGTRARRIGAVAGQLWGRVGYTLHCSQYWQMPYSCSIGAPGTLNDEYPTGYDAFYCMKYELTQGQYAAYLNSLSPEIAAGRAHVPGGAIPAEVWKDRPWESGGHTITVPGRLVMASIPSKPEDRDLDLGADADSLDMDMDMDMEGDLAAAMSASEAPKVKIAPVYTARVPHRTCNFIGWYDGYAYAGWAGLRPMTELEFEKVCRGPLSPVPNEHAWGSTAMIAATNLQDSGLATEHYDNGNSHVLFWRNPPETQVTRAGIFATPDSDRVAAGASYWGVLEMEIATATIPVATTNGRAFRGLHGNGSLPAGAFPGPSVPTDWTTPGGRMGLLMSHRTAANTPSDRPPTYPRSGDGRSHCSCWRGVRSAPTQGVKPTAAPAGAAAARSEAGAGQEPEVVDIAQDTIRIANVRWEAGTKAYSTVTFDLSWNNSWRTAWTEPADKNVTGKPLKVESWDAAWVFVKFLPGKDAKKGAGENSWGHATLDTDVSSHTVPAGATAAVGLSDDQNRGAGVFVYRAAAGQGANDFKQVKLRWLHGEDKVDPARVELAMHGIAMVYVPEGPFKSKSPWGHPLALISNGDATKAGGYRVEQADEYEHVWGKEHVERLKRVRLEAGTAPKDGAWPNGYKAFYCMKYSISQGQYAAFLNSLPGGQAGLRGLYNVSRFTIRHVADKGYTADVPDRACNFLAWSDIHSYTAWSGLRPITDLEYEKACRGPREVAQAEDAWTAATCNPSAALGKVAGSSASYWGIRELSLTGIPFEWPQTVANEEGFAFKGTHGEGSLALPSDWPREGHLGRLYEDDYGWGFMVGFWFDPADMGRIQEAWGGLYSDRTGRYGARAARSAPTETGGPSALKVDRPPDLRGYDVGIFYLSGRFDNESDKPLKVELKAPLPDACFPEGRASRTFTARPKAVTQFRILTGLNVDNAAHGLRGERSMTVRLQSDSGEVLAEKSVLFLINKPEDLKPQVIGSLTGGALTLRITNATDRACAVAINMTPPAGVSIPGPDRRIELAAGAQVRASFPIPAQVFGGDGVIRVPYRVAVAGGAQQYGETVADLVVQSRWWVRSRIETLSEFGVPDKFPKGVAGEAKAVAAGSHIFKAAVPPKGWEQVTCGKSVEFGKFAKPLTPGSVVTAGARVTAPEDRDVVVSLPDKLSRENVRFIERIWFNDAVVYESRVDGEGEKRRKVPKSKPFRVNKGGNTILMECLSSSGESGKPVDITLQFSDAKTGKQIDGLVFDIGKR